MWHTVVWVDPGLKTGIAVYKRDTQKVTVIETTLETTWMTMRDLVPPGPGVAIGWEHFYITAKTAKLTQAPWSLEIIGICRGWAFQKEWDILPAAAPSDRHLGAVKFVDALGWCPRGMRDDGMSACQHLLAWLLRTQLAPAHVYDTIASVT